MRSRSPFGCSLALACALVALTGCAGEVEVTGVQTRTKAERLDALSMTLEVGADRIAAGESVRSRLVVRNPSATTVTDADCAIGSGRYALVPVDDPAAAVWSQPTVDCGGPFAMPSGFGDDRAGPEFTAQGGYSEPLPPGEYLAVLEIDGFSERLVRTVTVE